MAAQPVISSVTPLSTTVEKWGKFEAKLALTSSFTNPFDYDEIAVKAVFTAPDGSEKTADGFFMQDYNFTNQTTGAVATVGQGAFKIRFSPDQIGSWKYKLSCTTAAGTGSFAEKIFECTAVVSLKNRGFIKADQTNYLHFDDGGQYIPIGENMAWGTGNQYPDFKKWLTDLAANGGNFIRLWHCSWGLGLEWLNGSNGYAGLRKYKQTNCFYLDWMMDFCTEKGIGVMTCLQHHGQVSTQVNPNWSESPYNSANGGPCASTDQFFTNAAAKNHVKNRLRYVIARWGYSRAVQSWELFNEVSWTDNFVQNQSKVADWHFEMAAFLKQKDPQGHLVTTSYADDQSDPAVWASPDIDFTQTHCYVGTPWLERVLQKGNLKYLNQHGKPTLNGEFGLDAQASGLGTVDPTGIHIHNTAWGSLFSGALGTGMTWWWDSYIAPKNLYSHFAGVAEITSKIPFQKENFGPAIVTATGAASDLTLSPTLSGWGALADTLFEIGAGGQLANPNASLASFLYGSVRNAQLKRAPVFKANFPAAGKFRVKTAGSAGNLPKIVIFLDGVKKLDVAAAINTTYEINVPSGQHTIKVDNLGTDWISISSYELPGIGSTVDAYAVRSEDKNRLAAWVLNNRYNYDFVKNVGQPPVSTGAILTNEGFENGQFTASFYDCLTGAFLSSQPVTVAGGKLTVALPDFLWDVVVVVESQPLGAPDLAQNALEFSVFPNPTFVAI